MDDPAPGVTLGRLVDYLQYDWMDDWSDLASRYLSYGNNGRCPDRTLSRNLAAQSETKSIGNWFFIMKHFDRQGEKVILPEKFYIRA